MNINRQTPERIVWAIQNLRLRIKVLGQVHDLKLCVRHHSRVYNKDTVMNVRRKKLCTVRSSIHKLQRAETRNENPATQIPDFEFTILERNLFAEDVNRTRNMAMVKHCRAIFTRQDVGLSHLVEGYLYDEVGNEILQMVSDLQDKATGDTVLNDTDKDLEEARQTCRDFENLNLQKY